MFYMNYSWLEQFPFYDIKHDHNLALNQRIIRRILQYFQRNNRKKSRKFFGKAQASRD